jgi:hypothetical protein
MLDSCAKGYSAKRSLHSLKINLGPLYYPLPRGDSGQNDPEIERSHVKKMAQKLCLSTACVNGHFEDMLPEEPAAV